jgi:5-methylcytosine-specific restriction endonuclease McrA
MSPQEYKQIKFSKTLQQHCWMCGLAISYGSATVDHLLPKSKGGMNTQSNFRLACKPCNTARANRTLTQEEWQRATGKQKAKANRFAELAAAIRGNGCE